VKRLVSGAPKTSEGRPEWWNLESTRTQVAAIEGDYARLVSLAGAASSYFGSRIPMDFFTLEKALETLDTNYRKLPAPMDAERLKESETSWDELRSSALHLIDAVQTTGLRLAWKQEGATRAPKGLLRRSRWWLSEFWFNLRHP